MPHNLPHKLSQELPYNNLPYRKNVKMWNDTAKDCYYLNCSCEDCFIYKTYFYKTSESCKMTYFYNTDETCKMKYYVYYFLKKLGAPEENFA